MINFHNLDAYSDCFLGFNIASDTLEFLDDEIKAPRISRDKNYFIPTYVLPDGFNLLPENKFKEIVDKGILKKMFDINDLGIITGIFIKEDYQEVCCNKGIIEIRDGVCKGLGFEGWYAKNVTFPIAMLLNSCND